MAGTRWNTIDGKLNRRFEFANFADALVFVNRVGGLAEAAGHHPDICFGWGYVEVTLFTHSKGAVTAKDNELSEAVDRLR